MVKDTKVTCDGCGQEIVTESQYPDYSHFELVPVHYINKSMWGYPMGYIPQDVMQFCRKCRNTMMLALPIKYYQCGICMHPIKGQVGQSLKSLEEMHKKGVHPNYSFVTYDGGLSSARCFAGTTLVDDSSSFTGKSVVEPIFPNDEENAELGDPE